MHYTLPAIVALAGLASAVPTPQESNDPWEGVIDPWGQYGRKPENMKRSTIELTNDDGATNATTIRIAGLDYEPEELLRLAKRASIDDFVGKIPTCSKEDDPSNKDVPKPNWPVNHGVKIPKNGDHDQCTTGKRADHCWTEYYLVEAAVEYYSWLPTGSAINCSPGEKDTCSIAVTSLAQSCTLTTTSHTEGWDWKILDLAGKLGVEFEAWGQKSSADLSAGGSISHSWANTNAKATQSCRADQSTATCSWANSPGSSEADRCHQVWYADRVLHVWGQAQRVCNKCTGNQVQQNTGDGRVCVRGQKEFDFKLPINKLVHCNGKCGTNEPGVAQPQNEPRGPYVQPNNWDLLVIGN